MSEDKIFFGVEVSKERAEYLHKCLETPLCLSCRREEDECNADPCTDKQIENGELEVCTGCTATYDPAHLVDGKCPECRAEPQLFAVRVTETITYTAWVSAINEKQANAALDYMECNDWDPILTSCEFSKYGYDIVSRNWAIDDPTASEKEMCGSRDIVIDAKDWIDG